MSVLIKDMEKPKSCYAVIDGEPKYCPFINTDDDCVLQLEKGICEGTWADQYSKCPLIEAPEPCEDAVSREAVSEWLQQYGQDVLHGKYKFSLMYIWKNFMDLPSAQLERKKGAWLANGDIPKECPFCGEDWDKYVFGDIWYTGELPKFCPNCGEDMRGGND